jgi:hypothetical protein
MRDTRHWWRSTSGLARALTIVFAAEATFQVLSVFADDMTTWLDRLQTAFNAELHGHDKLAQTRFNHVGATPGFFQAAGLASTVALVLIIIWQWRSAKNAEALGRTGARLSPGWSIAGWLIPVANLVLPYLIVQDLWRSSDPEAVPGTEWRRLKGAPLVAQWWIAYVASLVIVPTALAVVLFGSTSASDASWALNVGRLLAAGACVLAIFVVREITSRQEQQQATAPAPMSPQAALPGSLPPPGWYIDPRGRFDWRYWSGSAWTEWVSTDGETSLDPV